jgi:Glycosyltransferase family 87
MSVAILASAPAALAVRGPSASVGKAPQQQSVVTVGDVAPPHGLPKQDPLTPRIYLPYSQTSRPPGFVLDAIQARQIAERTPAVQRARAKYPHLRPISYLSPLQLPAGAFWHWDIIYSAGGKQRVEVEIQPITGDVLQVTEPPDIGWPLLLGFPGVLGGKLNAPWIWIPLCLLFLIPFIDPRRPFRLLHLDLLVLLSFGVSQIFFTAGKPDLSVPLVYPPLVYCAVRAAFAGFRSRRRRGPLMPHVSTRFLIAGVAVLLALRVAFGVTWSTTFDVSTAGVIGADRIEHRLPLYVDNDAHGDTYGPVNYLMYVPWELLFPFHPPAGDAARAATLSFDLLTLLGLFLLGRSLRPGPNGTRLGAALAWAWCTFPYTALVIASTTNDALVPLFVIYALLFLRSPPARGVLSGIASMAKFAPALIAPMLIVGRGPFRWRQVIVASVAYLIVVVGLIWAFLPPGGLKVFWNTTLGFQLHRTSPLSLWVRDPSFVWLRPVASVLAIGLAIAAAFYPRRRTIGQIAALVAAVFAASQIPTDYWLYFYVIWFAPFLFVALFEEYAALGPSDQASVNGDFEKPEMISQPESVTATRSSMRTPSLPGM